MNMVSKIQSFRGSPVTSNNRRKCLRFFIKHMLIWGLFLVYVGGKTIILIIVVMRKYSWKQQHSLKLFNFAIIKVPLLRKCLHYQLKAYYFTGFPFSVNFLQQFPLMLFQSSVFVNVKTLAICYADKQTNRQMHAANRQPPTTTHWICEIQQVKYTVNTWLDY